MPPAEVSAFLLTHRILLAIKRSTTNIERILHRDRDKPISICSRFPNFALLLNRYVMMERFCRRKRNIPKYQLALHILSHFHGLNIDQLDFYWHTQLSQLIWVHIITDTLIKFCHLLCETECQIFHIFWNLSRISICACVVLLIVWHRMVRWFNNNGRILCISYHIILTILFWCEKSRCC